MPDGRCRILSFLLPGDFACAVSLFEPMSGRLVEAVTEATCHSFKRNELKSFLFAHPELIEMLTRIRIEERKQSDQLITEETEKWGKVIRSASIKPE